ncbi:MAG: MBL fold metallo-hydrolase [Actinomycetota bacterium]|nr:MBL fold metallo-hydrolase [Actinomycetota bacterium]
MGRSAAEDRSVLAELDLLRRGERILPAGTTIEWLGTAGFRLRAEGTTILIDPFLTRRGLGETLGSACVHADPATVARLAPEADAVLIGHCHFDHAMDVPELARRGATVYGSSNVTRLLGLHGLADSAVEVDPQVVYEIGPFTVRFVPSRHSKLVLGLAVPSDGELTCDSLDSLSSNAYRCGQVYGIHIEVDGTTIYHLGSADLLEDEYRLGPVDLLLCCIAGRSMTRDFTPRMLSTFDPSLVVPHHLDDFFAPIDAPMGLSLNIDVSGFVDDVRRVDPSLDLATLTPFRPYRA